jgi:threonine/homoserine/homoserine lactone efflux protein
MTLAEFSIFATSAALLLFMPGPTNALMMTSGALAGIRRSMPLIPFEIAGYLLAIIPLLAIDALSAGFRLELSLLLKSLAAIVAIASAARLWRRARSDSLVAASPTSLGIFLQTLFNPKALIFAFAIIPPVVEPASLVVKIATFVALVFLAASFWTVVGATSRSTEILPRHWIARISSIMLTGYAVYFAMSVIRVAA